MQAFGLARVGRDVEVRHPSNGDPVANVSLAFNYGRKSDDGRRPTQWVEGALWGKRAEAMASHLTKGTAVMVTLDDVRIEMFTDRDGNEKSKLVGRISAIEFAGGGERTTAPPPPPPPPPKPAPKAAALLSGFDDDIPF